MGILPVSSWVLVPHSLEHESSHYFELFIFIFEIFYQERTLLPINHNLLFWITLDLFSISSFMELVHATLASLHGYRLTT